MILYDFKCDICGFMDSIFKDPENLIEHTCPKCDEKMRRIFSSPTIKIAFRAGHDPYTGMDFDSQRQRENYMAENGIIKGD